MKLVNIGFGNLVAVERIISVLLPDSAPVKRIIADAKEQGTLIDATSGRRTRSVIITDSSHVILTFMDTEKLYFGINEDKPTTFEDMKEKLI